MVEEDDDKYEARNKCSSLGICFLAFCLVGVCVGTLIAILQDGDDNLNDNSLFRTKKYTAFPTTVPTLPPTFGGDSLFIIVGDQCIDLNFANKNENILSLLDCENLCFSKNCTGFQYEENVNECYLFEQGVYPSVNSTALQGTLENACVIKLYPQRNLFFRTATEKTCSPRFSYLEKYMSQKTCRLLCVNNNRCSEFGFHDDGSCFILEENIFNIEGKDNLSCFSVNFVGNFFESDGFCQIGGKNGSRSVYNTNIESSLCSPSDNLYNCLEKNCSGSQYIDLTKSCISYDFNSLPDSSRITFEFLNLTRTDDKCVLRTTNQGIERTKSERLYVCSDANFLVTSLTFESDCEWMCRNRNYCYGYGIKSENNKLNCYLYYDAPPNYILGYNISNIDYCYSLSGRTNEINLPKAKTLNYTIGFKAVSKYCGLNGQGGEDFYNPDFMFGDDTSLTVQECQTFCESRGICLGFQFDLTAPIYSCIAYRGGLWPDSFNDNGNYASPPEPNTACYVLISNFINTENALIEFSSANFELQSRCFTDFVSSSISNLKEEECIAHCEQDSSCAGYIYYEATVNKCEFTNYPDPPSYTPGFPFQDTPITPEAASCRDKNYRLNNYKLIGYDCVIENPATPEPGVVFNFLGTWCDLLFFDVELEASSSYQCEFLCSFRETCITYYFNQVNNKCFLSSQITPPNSGGSTQNTESVCKTRNIVTSPLVVLSDGAVLGNINTTLYCSRICDSYPGCSAFQEQDFDKACKLYTYKQVPTAIDFNTNNPRNKCFLKQTDLVSFRSNTSLSIEDGECFGTPIENQVQLFIDGFDKGEACLKACKSRPDCKGYVYLDFLAAQFKPCRLYIKNPPSQGDSPFLPGPLQPYCQDIGESQTKRTLPPVTSFPTQAPTIAAVFCTTFENDLIDDGIQFYTYNQLPSVFASGYIDVLESLGATNVVDASINNRMRISFDNFLSSLNTLLQACNNYQNSQGFVGTNIWSFLITDNGSNGFFLTVPYIDPNQLIVPTNIFTPLTGLVSLSTNLEAIDSPTCPTPP